MTEEELRSIRLECLKQTIKAAAESVEGASPNEVLGIAHKFADFVINGVTEPTEVEAGTVQAKRHSVKWTPERDEEFRRLNAQFTARQLGEHFGITAGAAQAHRKILGLSGNMSRNDALVIGRATRAAQRDAAKRAVA